MSERLLSVRIRHEHDIVGARRRARQIADALGFDTPEQTRIATTVSELARNAFAYARGGTVEYSVEGVLAPQVLIIQVLDEGPGIADVERVLSGQYRSQTGMGLGLIGARRLMDGFDLSTGPGGTTVTVKAPRRQLGALAPLQPIPDVVVRPLSEQPAEPALPPARS